jgi:hypothetical protein
VILQGLLIAAIDVIAAIVAMITIIMNMNMVPTLLLSTI